MEAWRSASASIRGHRTKRGLDSLLDANVRQQWRRDAAAIFLLSEEAEESFFRFPE